MCIRDSYSTGELPVLQEPGTVIQDITAFFDSVSDNQCPVMVPLRTMLKHTKKISTTSPLYVLSIMDTFAQATIKSWKKESAKTFLSDLWPFLFDIKLYFANMGTESTDFSFKVDMIYDKSRKATSRLRRSSRSSRSSNLRATTTTDEGSLKSSSIHYNQGVRRPDFTLSKRERHQQDQIFSNELVVSRKPLILSLIHI